MPGWSSSSSSDCKGKKLTKTVHSKSRVILTYLLVLKLMKLSENNIIQIIVGDTAQSKKPFFLIKKTGSKSYLHVQYKKTLAACASIFGGDNKTTHNGQHCQRRQHQDGRIFFVFPPRLGGCTEICLNECIPLGHLDALSRPILRF